MSDPVVSLRSVTKRYSVERLSDAGLKNLLLHLPETLRAHRSGGRFTALEGLSLDVRPGEFPRGQNRNYPPAPIVQLFQEYGFHWGIFFTTPDPHHFQFATGA